MEKEVTILDIIRSVRLELAQMKKEKDELERSLGSIRTELKGIEDKEFALRDRVSKLIDVEMRLNKKRMDFEKKMLRLREKISKVSNVSRELNEVWS